MHFLLECYSICKLVIYINLCSKSFLLVFKRACLCVTTKSIFLTASRFHRGVFFFAHCKASSTIFPFMVPDKLLWLTHHLKQNSNLFDFSLTLGQILLTRMYQKHEGSSDYRRNYSTNLYHCLQAS